MQVHLRMLPPSAPDTEQEASGGNDKCVRAVCACECYLKLCKQCASEASLAFAGIGQHRGSVPAH
eukprot:2644761-Pleurochrysis_carterae.AAC.1